MKPTQLKGTLSVRRKIRYLKAYYYQGGKWRRVGKVLGGKV